MQIQRSNPYLKKLFEPSDIAMLVYFRIVFGAVMLWEVFRYFEYGWISDYWIEPKFNFTYYGFGWLEPWPGDGMYIHFIVMGILAVGLGVVFSLACPPQLVAPPFETTLIYLECNKQNGWIPTGTPRINQRSSAQDGNKFLILGKWESLN